MLLSAAVWLASFALFIHGAAPGAVFEDTAELATVAYTLSNAHPPGYPLHALLGGLALLLPLGSVVFRLNALSAVCGGFAVVAVFRLGSLAAGVLGGSSRQSLAAGLSAAAAFATSASFWWQSGIAEKYPLFIALFGWSVWALARHRLEGGAGRLYAAFLLAGAALAAHYQAVYLAVPLVLALWGARSGRIRAQAAFLFLLPVALRLAYAPIRAAAEPPINWGYPDTLGRLLAYAGVQVYREARLFSGTVTDYGVNLFTHLTVVPGQEIGLVAVAAALGLAYSFRVRWLAWGVVSVVAVNLAVAAGYRSPHYSLYDFPFLLLACVMAGTAASWWAGRWRPALAVAPAILLAYGVATNHGTASRSRDYTARDHLRNLVASAPAGSVVVSGYEAWLCFPWMEHEVGGNPGINGLYVGALAQGDPGRRILPRVLGPGAALLAREQDGVPVLLRAAEVARPRAVLEDFFSIIQPSTGVRWRGILLELGVPAGSPPFDDESMARVRALRLRGLLNPAGGAEVFIVRCYSTGLMAQGRAALAAGRPKDALRLARLGLRLDPRLPELLDLEGRAELALGALNRAEDAWKTAIEVTQAARFNYFEPFLGMAEVARKRGKREAALENLRTAALMGGAGLAEVRAADRARKEGRAVEAEAAYRRAIALAFDRYGRSYMDSLKVAQAARSWETALEFNPRSAQTLYSLGTVAALEERFDAALGWFDRAAVLAPRGVEIAEARRKAREALAWRAKIPALEARLLREAPSASLSVDLGNAYWYLGRAKVAEGLYRDAIRLDPRSARAWGNLGSALVEQRRLGEAIKAYSHAVEGDPENAGAMVNLGAVHLGMGERAKALKWLERALEADPGNERAMELLAEARAGRGG